ncbi:hypothetical protein XH91_00385 [Bradyrhizobium guangzhouense]|uniref:Uncharacterized protein n=1 Tax=Bradyrhizobium guangzhouense TaxID=1325095 RepID=A0AAE5WVP9_9BRAD|nr:hypothetical protein XH91_00385 [Bradyrhizobium guangzhouense]
MRVLSSGGVSRCGESPLPNPPPQAGEGAHLASRKQSHQPLTPSTTNQITAELREAGTPRRAFFWGRVCVHGLDSYRWSRGGGIVV